MRHNLKPDKRDDALTPSTRMGFQTKMRRAAQDNPDLPDSFIAESLMSLAEPRKDSAPFVPRSSTGTSTAI